MCRWCICNWHVTAPIFMCRHFTSTRNSKRKKYIGNIDWTLPGPKNSIHCSNVASEWYFFKRNEFKLCTTHSHWLSKSRWQFIIVLNSRSFTSYHWFDAFVIFVTHAIHSSIQSIVWATNVSLSLSLFYLFIILFCENVQMTLMPFIKMAFIVAFINFSCFVHVPISFNSIKYFNKEEFAYSFENTEYYLTTSHRVRFE